MLYRIILVLYLSVFSNGSKYNVLFLSVDDLKPTLGAYGDKVADTPNIDRLLAQGLRFENMHAQKTECAPSRISMLSGKRNDAIRMWGFNEDYRARNPSKATLPGQLRINGYETIAVGKILDNRNFPDIDATKTGPDECTKSSQTRCSFDEYTTIQMFYDDPKYCDGQTALRWPTDDVSLNQEDKRLHLVYEFGDHLTTRHIDYCVANKAINELKRLAGSSKPFFLAIGFAKPHMPWTAPVKDFAGFRKVPDSEFEPPPAFSEALAENDFWTDTSSLLTQVEANGELNAFYDSVQYDIAERARAYYASTRFVDRQIGKILDVLENGIDATVRNNTMVILWGDHGFHLGEFGLWGKKTILEHATRVPFGIVPPRHYLSQPQNVDIVANGVGKATIAPTDTVDMYPTVLEIVGVARPTSPSRLAGTSLVPLLRDPSSSVRSAAISEYESYGRSNYMGYSIRTKHYRLIAHVRLYKSNGALAKNSHEKLELYRYINPGVFETVNQIDNPAFAHAKKSLLKILTDAYDGNPDWTHLIGKIPFDQAYRR